MMTLIVLLVFLLCGPSLLSAQQTKDKWQRVYTGANALGRCVSSVKKIALMTFVCEYAVKLE